MSRPIIYFVVTVIAVFFGMVAAIGHGRTAPALMLANVYHDQRPLNAYWVSEKLDGVRAYWDGHHLISRQGNRFAAPTWFTDDFPAMPLDGELWMGRGTFSTLSGAVRRDTPNPDQWRHIHYMVFDMPRADGTFDRRLARLQALFSRHHSAHMRLIHQVRATDHAHLMARLHRVVKGGGEGLMLHRGDAPYHGYRSNDLLKLKLFHDADARVMARLPGAGKYQGMMGALLVETPRGRQFRLGTGFSDKQRAHPPAIGSIITYRYRGRTESGLPRFPSFMRVRRPPDK